MSTAPAPAPVPTKVPIDVAALGQAVFFEHLPSLDAVQEALHEDQLKDDAQHRGAAGFLPEDAAEETSSGLFVAYHAPALPDPGVWLAGVAADLGSPGADPGGAEQEAPQPGGFAAPQDGKIPDLSGLGHQVLPAAWATPLVGGLTDGAPVFELTSEPSSGLSLQAVSAVVADTPTGTGAVDGGLLPSQALSALDPLGALEIDWAHQPQLPWWMPRPPNIEVRGLPGLVAARQDGAWLPAVEPTSLGSAATTSAGTAVPDFVYQQFEWDQDFGFNPWNSAP